MTPGKIVLKPRKPTMTAGEYEFMIDMSLIMAGMGLILMQNAAPHAREMAKAFERRVEQMRVRLEQESILRGIFG